MAYPGVRGTLPMHYAPFRRATIRVSPEFALDLHGLATPPAFVLSQDQTLHFIIVPALAGNGSMGRLKLVLRPNRYQSGPVFVDIHGRDARATEKGQTQNPAVVTVSGI